MESGNFLKRIWELYADGFRQMTVGRTLWMLIAVKLIIIFAVLKWLFFPNFIKEHAADGREADFVAGEVLK
ncbi:MAG: DUF4492 domain-containing protein [Bacteroidales bacterium]|nr:DUF4492 domain-containing protein [Bacteroidales bacterium]MCM1147357.1 DUF4492 domain-containing protein [Bacteroidales bacterium]MCM1206207.1 DUF4492 domain-containing protein [Bacillota bacterium]MCM1510441.1 DUF4492 domain-containing protein [Clostridium sp.]